MCAVRYFFLLASGIVLFAFVEYYKLPMPRSSNQPASVTSFTGAADEEDDLIDGFHRSRPFDILFIVGKLQLSWNNLLFII
jgi:hypothetical protein